MIQLYNYFHYITYQIICYYLKICSSLSIEINVFSKELKAVKRKYPSPFGPNPLPGVPTIFALVNKISNSHSTKNQNNNLLRSYNFISTNFNRIINQK